MNAGTPLSLLMIAGGAVLRWGVTDTAESVDLAAIGVILMVVGAIGLLLSLLFWSTLFGGWGAWGGHDRGTRVVAHQREPDVVIEERQRPRTVVRTERYDGEEPHHHV